MAVAGWIGGIGCLRWQLLGLLLLSCAAVADPLERASQPRPTLHMLTLENPPLEFTTADGKVGGIVVDLVREATRRTGRPVRIQVYPWKRVINEVANGNADGAFNAGKNAVRESWGHYHQSVLIEETYVLFSRGSLFLSSNLEEAPQLNIGTQLGYFYGEQFHALVARAPFKSTLEVPSIEHNLRLLMGNRIDVFVGDLLPTLYYVKKMGLEGRIHVVQEKNTNKNLIVSISPTYVAFSRKTVDKSYVAAFDAALGAMKRDGTYARVFADYGVQLPVEP